MAAEVKCPNCGTEFDPGESFKKEVQEQLRSQMEDWKKKKEKEFVDKENIFQEQLQLKDEELNKRLTEEKQKLQNELQISLRKSISSDFENQLKLLQESVSENEEKLKLSRKKELDFLQKEKLLHDKEAELELNLQRQLMNEREKMKEQLQKEENEKLSLKEQEFELKLKEKEKQLEDQKKLVDEMKRKSEQGSMQLQGEVQELLLEEILRNTFPFDEINEVGKGVRGADCIQTVRNQFGNEAGKIIYESKRTKDFGGDWIEKLKKDMRSFGADAAIIVTQAFPKDMERFGEKDGVYICTFAEVRSVALLLRNALLKIAEAKKSQENKGDKAVAMYNYITSQEFIGNMNAMRDGFRNLRAMMQKEKEDFEKNWKKKEKHIEMIIQNSLQISGSVEGIAGNDTINLNLIEDNDIELLE
jgi:hypothetical protein